jgi:hypothetical protein
MGMTLGWIAIALAGTAGGPEPARDPVRIEYVIKMVEVDGVGWRQSVLPYLKPVTRQGAATVWTAPSPAIARVLDDIATKHTGTIFSAPKVIAFGGASAAVISRRNEQFVTQASWKGDEPVGKAPPEVVRTGWHATMNGRKLDQGILARIVIEDTMVRAIHRVQTSCAGAGTCSTAQFGEVSIPANVVAKIETAPVGRFMVALRVGAKAACTPETCANADDRFETAGHTVKDQDVQTVALEVPEIGTQEVAGEWLICSGDVLLVSFGAYTIADSAGKAVVKERLAIVEAQPVSVVAGALPANASAVPPVPRPRALPDLPFAPPPAMPPAPAVPLSMPVVPSRTIPQGVHADGTLAPLPPLPADDMNDDDSTESSEPRPSPQMKTPKPTTPAKPVTDASASRADYKEPRSSTIFLPSLFMPSPSVGFQFLLPIKPLSFRLPLGQKLEIEVYGRVVPNSEASAPANAAIDSAKTAD